MTSSKSLANVLLNVSIAIQEVEAELGELQNDDQIEQLDHDLITLINISNVLTPHIR